MEFDILMVLVGFTDFVNNNPLIALIAFGSFIVTTSFSFLGMILSQDKKRSEIKKNKELQDQIDGLIQNEISDPDTSSFSIEEAEKIFNYLDILIKDKFNQQLYSQLLPQYMNSNGPDTALVKEIIDRVYVTVTATLTPAMKTRILKYYTQRGIELLIREKVSSLINEIDFTMSGKASNSAFKELNTRNIDQIL